jgi:drug/metabolite transporter (DMT)-like permease
MWIIALLFLILFEAIADIFSKEYSINGAAIYWILAISGFIIANAFWLFSIRKGSGLARGAVLFSIGSAIIAVIIGYLKYGEKIGKVEFFGMLFGIIAIVLIFWSDFITLFRS